MIRTAPPALAELLLVLLLGPGEWAESIAGDLHEEHARLLDADRPLAGFRAHAWYWMVALRLGFGGAARRAAARRRPTDIPAAAPTHGDSLMRTLNLLMWRGRKW
ncbi:MAG: hypothetical protein ABJC89_24915, partial [Acidobacteriota bacterium]